MDRLEFVDTHFHFWDHQHPVLVYKWPEPPPGVEPAGGPRFHELKTFNYLAEDYIAETRNANVTKAVHVQVAIGTEDPVEETRWLQGTADRTGFPHGIVAHASLKEPRVEEVLARHAEYANIRGIRDFSDGDFLVDPDFQRGYALLERFDYCSSVDLRWQTMGKARDLAAKYPNIPMVVDHAGEPVERTDEYFERWSRGMRTVAEAENTWCKISGLGMFDRNWTVESIRRWVLECIEAFGPKRCFFGTNWPVDRLYSTYDTLIDAYTEIVSDFSTEEKTDMFSRNAERLYRI